MAGQLSFNFRARMANATMRLLSVFFGPKKIVSCLALGIAFWLCIPTVGWGQAFQRSLTEVKVYGAKSEKVEFFFSRPYQGKPEVRLEKGTLKVRFSATGAQPPVQTLQPPPQSLYQQIRIQQNRYGVSTHFMLTATTQLQPKKIRFEYANNRLIMHLESALVTSLRAPPIPTNTVANPNTLANTAPDLSLWRAVGVIMVALVVMLGGLYGALMVYRKLLDKRQAGARKMNLEIVATFALGPKQQVVILDIDGERIACGVTPQNISFLTHLNVRQRQPETSQAVPNQPPLTSTTPTIPQEPASKDPMRQFAHALKHKVRSMREMP